jgi:hypothetical protein
MFLPTLIVTIAILATAVAMIGIRMFFVKDGSFRGSCATNNPMIKNEFGECSVCGRKSGEDCKQEDVQPA